MSNIRISIVIEIEAAELFENENVNWDYCVSQASLLANDACEFMMYVSEPDVLDECVENMILFGCTDSFVKAYKYAASVGANYILFYA